MTKRRCLFINEFGQRCIKKFGHDRKKDNKGNPLKPHKFDYKPRMGQELRKRVKPRAEDHRKDRIQFKDSNREHKSLNTRKGGKRY